MSQNVGHQWWNIEEIEDMPGEEIVKKSQENDILLETLSEIESVSLSDKDKYKDYNAY